MKLPPVPKSLLGVSLLFGLASSLQVAPGSPCARKCLGSTSDNPWSASDSSTNASEITCSDSAYSNSRVGIKFKQCLECLRTSSRGNMDETDAKWFVYNLRFALDSCLFDVPEAADDASSSGCVTNKACRKLKSALTSDDLAATQTSAWDYCSADDGTFMGSDRDTCMKCLRGSKDQTYMANFMTALEAGCRQIPEKGTAIGLSGTIFTSNAVSIVDPSEAKHDDHDKGSLSTPAIAGIAVGVVLVLMIAIGLIVLHCQREKTFHDNWEYEYYDAYAPRRPEPRPPRQSPTAQPEKLFYIRNNPVEKRMPYVSSGEYYDGLEQENQRGRTGYPMQNLAPKFSPPLTNTSSLPTHPAYDPRTVSRNAAGSETTARDLSAPPSIHKRIRSNTPDSFAVQAYLNAAEESARMAANSSSKASSPAIVTSNSPRSSKRGSKLSALSLPKILVPKKKTSPQFILQPPSSDHKDYQGDKNISRPVLASEEPRFHDNPVGGHAAVIAECPRPPTPEDEGKYAEYREVPLRSGKSALYGI